MFTAQFMPQGTRDLWDAFNALQRQSSSSENAARVLALTGGLDVVNLAPQARAPTLILHARDDHRPPFEQGRLLASLIPDSRFVTLDSSNHILLENEPAWPHFLEAFQPMPPHRGAHIVVEVGQPVRRLDQRWTGADAGLGEVDAVGGAAESDLLVDGRALGGCERLALPKLGHDPVTQLHRLRPGLKVVLPGEDDLHALRTGPEPPVGCPRQWARISAR